MAIPNLLSSIMLLLYVSLAAAVDKTLEENSKGADVTAACLWKLQRSGIFHDDQSLMSRLAWVETENGDSDRTYNKPDYHGGIWQLDEVYYLNSKDASLSSLHEAIARSFLITWENTTWKDCRKPMYSALGARLYFAYLNQTIPGTIDKQGDFWVNYYRKDGGSKVEWVEKVKELESKPKCSSSVDLSLVMDGSASIGQGNFDKAKHFMADAAVLMKNSSVNSNSTRVAVIMYSDKSEVIMDMMNNKSLAEMNSTIRNMKYPAGATNTTGALLTAVQIHKNATGTSGKPQVMAIFTDGGNNRDNETFSYAIQQVSKSNMTPVAVGVGSDINRTQLQEISLYNPSNEYELNDFDTLEEFLYQLDSTICEIPQELEIGEDRKGSCNRDEFKYYSYLIPSDGLTIKVDATSGSLKGWFSYTERTPNSAMHDGVISNGWGFVAPLISRQTGDRQSDDKVYVSLQGTEDSNEFTISTLMGNHVPSGSDGISSNAVVCLITLFIACMMIKS